MAEGPDERPPIHGVLQCPHTFIDFCLDNFKRIREGYEGLLQRLSAIETQFALLKVADEGVSSRLNALDKSFVDFKSSQREMANRLNGIESEIRATRIVLKVFAWIVGTSIAIGGLLVGISQLVKTL